MLRKTKIVATLGPSSSSPELIAELIAAGMNVARIALSHGSVEQHKQTIRNIREESQRQHKVVAVLLDLPGPKVRTTAIDSPVTLERGSRIELVPGDSGPSTAARLIVEYPTLLEDLKPGDKVGIGDGSIQMVVEEVTDAHATVHVEHGGEIQGRKGVTIPSERFRGNVPTAEDLRLIEVMRDADADYIAVSFVRKPDDMLEVKAAVGLDGPSLMAKIETATAVEHLEEIIDVSDAIMVARGDLGTDLPIEEIPPLQKRIIRETVRKQKPVLVATQMLESMIDTASPTRAEVTDVANAVFDQASAVMLSAETAVGIDPVNVVKTMDRIVRRAERDLDPKALALFATENRAMNNPNVATAHAALQASIDLGAAAILCCTRTGASARTVSSFRPMAPLIGLTPHERPLRQLALAWGVHPVMLPDSETTEEVFANAMRAAKEAGIVEIGDRVIVVAGSPSAGPGHTDSMRVAIVS